MGLFAPKSVAQNFQGTNPGDRHNNDSDSDGSMSQKHVLYILTERFQLCVVQYNEHTGELVTIAKVLSPPAPLTLSANSDYDESSLSLYIHYYISLIYQYNHHYH